MSAGSGIGDLPSPCSNRSVSLSNSSPQPELSVRARPPSSTLTVPGGTCSRRRQTNPHAATAHQQRHQQSGHHGDREDQHPGLAGVMGDLQVDERHRAVEADNGASRRALIEPDLVAGAQVDPLLFGQPALVDQPGIQGEQATGAARCPGRCRRGRYRRLPRGRSAPGNATTTGRRPAARSVRAGPGSRSRGCGARRDSG